MSTEFKPAPIKPQVSLEDLNKLNIRVGTIELVEDVQRSDKLVRCASISAITSVPSWSA